MTDFISIDWGTTSLRVSICADAGNRIIQTITNADGALSVNQRFLSSWDHSPVARQKFFHKVMEQALHQLDPGSKKNLPVLISGMASSSIGMENLPYAKFPFAIDGKDAVMKQWEDGGRQYYMVSGLATEEDIMRGEETQLIGAALLSALRPDEKALFVFPGTHAKHVEVADGRIQGFKTYMTGEVFCQMFSNSILAQSVNVHYDHNPSHTAAFIKGVAEGSTGNILQKMFKVRTNGMFQHMNKQENFSYLSGMLIGAELKDLESNEETRIILCGEGEMMQAYQLAMETTGILKDQQSLTAVDASVATALGQYRIFQQFSSRI